MPSAFYNINTGVISGSVNPSLTNADQIAALLKTGVGVMEVDASVNGANSMINLADNSVITLTPAPSIPDINSQGWAALIKKGVLNADDFHPVTVSRLNVDLTAASIAIVS